MRRNPLTQLLQTCPFLVIDGALATELEARGANLHDSLWSARILLEQPDLIRQVHYDYFAAGADVAITASYQATYAGLAAQGIDEKQASALLAHSVVLAQEARAAFWAALHNEDAQPSRPPSHAPRPFPLVAASIGPYGAYLADGSEYRGDYGLTQAALMAFHRQRIQTLAAAGPDLLACETIPCAVEAHALVALLAELAPQQPALPSAWISFACRNGEQLNSGESFQAAVAGVAQSPRVVAIGVNCTAPVYIENLLAQARAVTDKPLLVYPNRGEAWDANRRQWIIDPAAPSLADYAQTWRAAGAAGIGGCCRTGPNDIRQISHKLRNYEG